MPRKQDRVRAEESPEGPRTLRFGQDAPTGGLSVGLDRLLKTRMLVQAASGGGKSYLARALLEGTAADVQQIVLDPEGEFATLREQFPVVLASAGGEGDVPAAPENAAALCRGLMQLSASAVVDLSELKLADRRRFVRLFIEELMDLERELWRPLLVVLDEAHRYVPEKGAGEAESTDAVIALASQGRKRGFALCALTQRLSKLHKDVAAELLNVFVGMTQLDVDVGRAADALGFDRRRRGELRDLDHEFFAYGPALAAREPVRVRAGEVLTSHPEPGGLSGRVEATPPAPEELRAILGDLARSMATAGEDAPATGGRAGRKRNGGQHPKQGHEVEARASALAEERVRERLEDAVRRATEPLQKRIERLERLLRAAREDTVSLSEAIEEALVEPGQETEPSAGRTGYAREHPPASAPESELTEKTAAAGNGDASDGTAAADGQPKARSKILSTLCEMESMGLHSLERGNLAVFAAQGPRSSAFRDHLAVLKEEGYLHYPAAGQVALTRKGRGMAGGGSASREPRTLDELHAAWIRRLPDAGGRIVGALVEAYPGDLSRESLASAAGQSDRSSAFRAKVAELRSLGLVEYPARGTVRASATLFPDGLR